MNSDGKKSTKALALLGGSTLPSLVLRVVMIVAVQLLVLAGLYALIRAEIVTGTASDLWLVFAVIVICQMIGQVVSERPQGIEWAYTRLVASIIVRSAFPLIFVVATDMFVESGFVERTLIFLIVFYFVGLILSSAQLILKNQYYDASISQKSASLN